MRAFALVALLGGCTPIFGLESPKRLDAAMPDDMSVLADTWTADALGSGPWGAPMLALPSQLGDHDPTLTADLCELYFMRNNDIYRTTRASVASPWATPTIVSELSTADQELTPEISGDGLEIILASNRPFGAGGFDLWHSTRQSRASAWPFPSPLSGLNTADGEVAGPRSGDGLEIVFASNRAIGTGYDIYWSTQQAGAFGGTTKLSDVSSNAQDSGVFLSSDATTLYLHSLRDGGTVDLYVSTRLGLTSWTVPDGLGELNDKDFNDEDPWVSADSHHLFFASDRLGGVYQIFEAAR